MAYNPGKKLTPLCISVREKLLSSEVSEKNSYPNQITHTTPQTSNGQPLKPLIFISNLSRI